jgi:hypothetical protein
MPKSYQQGALLSKSISRSLNNSSFPYVYIQLFDAWRDTINGHEGSSSNKL